MADLELFSFEPRRHGLVEPAVQVLRRVIGEGQLANSANLPTAFAERITAPDAAQHGVDYVDVLVDYQILTPERRVAGQSAFEVIHAAPEATGHALRNHLLRTPPVPGRPHFQEVAVFLVSLFAFQQEQYGAKATRASFLEWAAASLPRISAADRPWLWDRGGVDALYMGFLRVEGDAVVAQPSVLQLILLLKTSYRPPPLPSAATPEADAPVPPAAPAPVASATAAAPRDAASTPLVTSTGRPDESDDAVRIAPRGRPREPRRPSADSFKKPDSPENAAPTPISPAAPTPAPAPVAPSAAATPARAPVAPAPVAPAPRPMSSPSAAGAPAVPVPAPARPGPSMGPAAAPLPATPAARPGSTPGAGPQGHLTPASRPGSPPGAAAHGPLTPPSRPGTSPGPSAPAASAPAGAGTSSQRRPGPDSQRRPAAAPPAPAADAEAVATVPPNTPIDLKGRLKDKLRREAAESGRQPAGAPAPAPAESAAPKPPAPLTDWQGRVLGASYTWGVLLFACTMLPVLMFGWSQAQLATDDAPVAVRASHWIIGEGVHLAFLYLAWALYILRGECVRDAGVAWYYALVAAAGGLLAGRLAGSPVGTAIAIDSPAQLRILLALLHAFAAVWVVALGVIGARLLSHPAGGLVVGLALSAPTIEISRALGGGHGELFGPGSWFWIGIFAFPFIVLESIAEPGPWGAPRPPGLFSRLIAGRLDDLPPPAPANPPGTAPSAGPAPANPSPAAR